MRDLILYIACSLDGYIARDNDQIDFLEGNTSEIVDYGYDAFLESVDTIIMGYKTYKELTEVLSPNHWPYKNQKVYVLSNHHEGSNEEVTFISGDIVSFVHALKEEKGKAIWLVGSAKTIEPFLKSNAIDTYVITIVPNLIGSGKRLFLNFTEDIHLKLVDHQNYNGMMMLTYKKR